MKTSDSEQCFSSSNVTVLDRRERVRVATDLSGSREPLDGGVRWEWGSSLTPPVSPPFGWEMKNSVTILLGTKYSSPFVKRKENYWRDSVEKVRLMSRVSLTPELKMSREMLWPRYFSSLELSPISGSQEMGGWYPSRPVLRRVISSWTWFKVGVIWGDEKETKPSGEALKVHTKLKTVDMRAIPRRM